MRLTSLSVTNFRNIENLNLSFDEEKRGVIFVGPNGSGKTNILEAIVTLLRGQPHRSLKSSELLRHGSKEALLGLNLQDAASENHYIGCQIADKEKLTKIDGAPLSGRVEVVRTFPLVSFFPDELETMRGEPALRRTLIDRTLGIFGDYVKAWLTYNRLLKNRNQLLRNKGDSQLIMVYGQKLAEAGEYLQALRSGYLAKLNHFFTVSGHNLKAPGEISLDLKPGFKVGHMAEELAEQKERENLLGRTTLGPHLADLEILIDGKPSRYTASQGQQRLLFVALKIATLEFYREILQENPLFILDDISSELGSGYIAAIYEAVPKESQLLISTISVNLLPFSTKDMQVLKVDELLEEPEKGR